MAGRPRIGHIRPRVQGTALRVIAALTLLGLGASSAQTFRFLTIRDRDTLDPLQAYSYAAGPVENVYEGLYGYLRGDPQTFEPLLATSYEVSDDGLEYTYRLRDGVRFSSGNPFTCDDVEYTIERALVVNPGDSGAWLLAEPLLGTAENAAALGMDATAEEYADYWRRIDASIECLDAQTAVFHLVEPDPAFFTKVMAPTFNIIDGAWAKSNGMWDGTQATWRDWIGANLREHYLQDHMSGTGAYRIAAWEKGVRITAEANPDYWGDQPAIKTFIYEVEEDQDARVAAMLAGDADWIYLDDPDALPQLVGRPGVRVIDEQEVAQNGWEPASVYGAYFNEAMSGNDNDYIGTGKFDGFGVPADFFSDRDVRRCFAYAFDATTYTRTVPSFAGAVLTMALDPAFLGYDPDVPTYTFDLARAEQYCRAAWGGALWDNGMYLTIPYPDELGQGFAEAWKTGLEALNDRFTIDARELDWDTFEEQLEANHLPIDVAGWSPDFPDPHAYVFPFYASTGYFPTTYGFANPAMDRLIEEAAKATDEVRRVELYSLVGWLGYREAPFVILPRAVATYVISDKITGFYINPMLASGFLWKDLGKRD